LPEALKARDGGVYDEGENASPPLRHKVTSAVYKRLETFDKKTKPLL
jgi:hypothetical protein